MSYHKLLERQLRRFLGGLERLPPGLEPFLSAVSEAYQAADEDRRIVLPVSQPGRAASEPASEPD